MSMLLDKLTRVCDNCKLPTDHVTIFENIYCGHAICVDCISTRPPIGQEDNCLVPDCSKPVYLKEVTSLADEYNNEMGN